MKPEIIPTILVKTFEEVKERIKLVENYVDWVQLDIMDGVFVENLTWNNPEDLKDFKTKVKLEAHLMVQNPEKIIDSWLEVVDRIIIHQESSANIKEIIEKVHKNKKSAEHQSCDRCSAARRVIIIAYSFSSYNSLNFTNFLFNSSISLYTF